MPARSLIARFAAIGLLAAIILIGVFGVAAPLQTAYSDTARRISVLYQDLANQEATLRGTEARRRSLDKLKKAGTIRDLTLPASSAGIAAAGMQERLARIVETAGGRLTTVQVLETASPGPVSRIGLRLQFTADTTQLRDILRSLEYSRPVTILDNVFIHSNSARAVGVERPLVVRLDVYAFLRRAL
jgi:hypothetical protein